MREQREVRNRSEKERSEGQKLKREEREAETEKRSEGQEMKTARSGVVYGVVVCMNRM